MAYIDDALDAGLLHDLAGRGLVHVLVVLPPALPRTQSSCERAPCHGLQRIDQWLRARGHGRTLGKTMSARLGVEIMSTSTSAGSPPRLLHGLPSSSFFTRYGTHLARSMRAKWLRGRARKRAPKKEAEGRHRPRDEAELVVVALLEPTLPGRRHRVGRRHGRRCAAAGHVRAGSRRERSAAGGRRGQKAAAASDREGPGPGPGATTHLCLPYK